MKFIAANFSEQGTPMGKVHASLQREAIKLPTTHLDRTVRDVQEELKDSLVAGKLKTCPCCGQKVKVWPRGITRKIAMALRAIYMDGPLLPRQMSAATGGSHDYPYVHAFGLASVNTQGRWQLTPKGQQFVEGKISIPYRVLMFNGERLAFAENKTVMFADALKEEFSFAGLMNPSAVSEAIVIMPDHGQPGDEIVGAPTFDHRKAGRQYDRAQYGA